jgi:hypothetical protein
MVNLPFALIGGIVDILLTDGSSASLPSWDSKGFRHSHQKWHSAGLPLPASDQRGRKGLEDCDISGFEKGEADDGVVPLVSVVTMEAIR